MKILITGAAGFIGNGLLRRLEAEHEVFALTSKSSHPVVGKKTRWIAQDLARPLDYSSLPNRIDAIFHLAQSRFYKQFPERARGIFEVNVDATFRLLDYARTVGAEKFIFASTGGVYGYSYEKFAETDPVSPLDFYLSSKYICELLIGNYQKFFHTNVFRLFFVYGAGQKQTMLIPRLVTSVLSGEAIMLHGNEGIQINPVHVSDVVSTLERSLGLQASHLINLAGPQVLSLREIANIIGSQLGREPVFTACADQESGHLVGDISKMKALLGGPSVAFPEGITEVCREVEQKELIQSQTE